MKTKLLFWILVNLVSYPAFADDYSYTNLCWTEDDGFKYRGSHGRVGTSFYEEFSLQDKKEPLGVSDAYIYEVDKFLQKKFEENCSEITPDENGVRKLNSLISQIETECHQQCEKIGNSHTRFTFFAQNQSQTMSQREADRFKKKCTNLCKADGDNHIRDAKIFAATARKGVNQCAAATRFGTSRTAQNSSNGRR